MERSCAQAAAVEVQQLLLNSRKRPCGEGERRPFCDPSNFFFSGRKSCSESEASRSLLQKVSWTDFSSRQRSCLAETFTFVFFSLQSRLIFPLLSLCLLLVSSSIIINKTKPSSPSRARHGCWVTVVINTRRWMRPQLEKCFTVHYCVPRMPKCQAF